MLATGLPLNDLASSLFSSALSFLSNSVVVVGDSEEFDSPDDESHPHRTLEQLKKDVEYCMSVMQVYDHLTGRMLSKHIPCGNWRNRLCPRCFDRRVKGFQIRIQRVVSEADAVRLVHEDSKACIRLVRKYNKKNCLRFPQADGTDFLFIATRDDVGREISQLNVGELDWQKFADTPERKNVSGGLGEPQKAGEGETVKAYSTCHLITDVTPEQIAEAEQEAYEKTQMLDPHTEEELKEAIGTREEAFKESVAKRGGHVIYKRRLYVNVILSGIDWLNKSGKNVSSSHYRIVRPYYEWST